MMTELNSITRQHRRPRGLRRPPNLAELIARSHAKYGRRLAAIATPTAPSYDTRTLGVAPPLQNQGQCGSCWDFSGVEVATSALIQDQQLPADGVTILSPQYMLDCVSDGGCNGDDNTTVLNQAQSAGLPTQADYGPYVGYAQRCQTKTGLKLYQVPDWGFADSNGGQGVTSTADIKEAMVTYGPIGCAVAADDAFEAYTGGVFAQTTSTSIDHDVLLVGWQDDSSIASGGYWIMQNSWGASWGESGYMRIAYGVNLIGTESVFASATPVPPPPPPPPPSPPPPPAGTMTMTLNGTPMDGSYALTPASSAKGFTPGPILLGIIGALSTEAANLPAPWAGIAAAFCAAFVPANPARRPCGCP